MREVRELSLGLVGALPAVEEVVAKTPNDHRHGEELIAAIIVAAVENRLDDRGLIDRAQMEMRKMMREGAVGEISLPEIGQFRCVLVGLERSGVTPFIDLRADQVCACEIPHDLSLE